MTLPFSDFYNLQSFYIWSFP